MALFIAKVLVNRRLTRVMQGDLPLEALTYGKVIEALLGSDTRLYR